MGRRLKSGPRGSAVLGTSGIVGGGYRRAIVCFDSSQLPGNTIERSRPIIQEYSAGHSVQTNLSYSQRK